MGSYSVSHHILIVSSRRCLHRFGRPYCHDFLDQSILFILLPQSLRRITPPLTNEVITLVKSSSLLSVISITELTRSAQVIIAERFTPFELYAELSVCYLVIISILAWFCEFVEKRLA